MANNFYPSISYISAITNSQNAVVTFTEDHEFTAGEIVSFRVEKQFGMSEINNVQTRILFVTDDSITTSIDTTFWTPFSLANLNQPGTTPPICVPSGSGLIPNTQELPTVNLQDAFDNRPI